MKANLLALLLQKLARAGADAAFPGMEVDADDVCRVQAMLLLQHFVHNRELTRPGRRDREVVPEFHHLLRAILHRDFEYLGGLRLVAEVREYIWLGPEDCRVFLQHVDVAVVRVPHCGSKDVLAG
eukprot:3131749-Rhodomonas_salina.2